MVIFLCFLLVSFGYGKNNIFTDFKKVPRIKPGETIKRSKTNSLRGIVMRKRKDIGVDEESIHQILVKGM